MAIDERLQQLGLALPDALRPPSGATYPFVWSRVQGDRVYLSGSGGGLSISQAGVIWDA